MLLHGNLKKINISCNNSLKGNLRCTTSLFLGSQSYLMFRRGWNECNMFKSAKVTSLHLIYDLHWVDGTALKRSLLVLFQIWITNFFIMPHWQTNGFYWAHYAHLPSPQPTAWRSSTFYLQGHRQGLNLLCPEKSKVDEGANRCQYILVTWNDELLSYVISSCDEIWSCGFGMRLMCRVRIPAQVTSYIFTSNSYKIEQYRI